MNRKIPSKPPAHSPPETLKKVVGVVKNSLKIYEGFGEEKFGIILFDGIQGEGRFEKLAMSSPCGVALHANSGKIGLYSKETRFSRRIHPDRSN